MCDGSSNSTANQSAKILSFSFHSDISKPIPLYMKIGGEKCLLTLGQTLFDLIYKEPVFTTLYSKAQVPMDPNFYYTYILHITGKKPYNGETVRKTQSKLNFKSDHFNLLMNLLAQAAARMSIHEDVIRELLQVALTTKNDIKGKPLQNTISFW
jgi:truncated hemoglobin YjbI